MTMPLRLWVVCALLLLAAFAAVALKPTQILKDKNLDLSTLIPERIGDWVIDPSIVPIKPTPDVQANLDAIYDQIVARTYVDSRGRQMMLSVAYGGDQSDALKAHRQEVCYAAQGFSIKELSHGRMKFGASMIPVTRMHAVMRNRSEPVTYWFTMGDSVVLSRVERLLVQVGYGLRGQVPDGMLVRVSSINPNPAQAWVEQEEFVAAMATSLGNRASRLIGKGV